MKSILTTVLINLGFAGAAGANDPVVKQAREKTAVDAAIPTCNPTV